MTERETPNAAMTRRCRIRHSLTIAQWNLLESLLDSALSAGGWDEMPERRKLAESTLEQLKRRYRLPRRRTK